MAQIIASLIFMARPPGRTTVYQRAKPDQDICLLNGHRSVTISFNPRSLTRWQNSGLSVRGCTNRFAIAVITPTMHTRQGACHQLRPAQPVCRGRRPSLPRLSAEESRWHDTCPVTPKRPLSAELHHETVPFPAAEAALTALCLIQYTWQALTYDKIAFRRPGTIVLPMWQNAVTDPDRGPPTKILRTIARHGVFGKSRRLL